MKTVLLLIVVLLLPLGALAQESPQSRGALVAALEKYISDFKSGPAAQKKLEREANPVSALEELVSAQDRSELESLDESLDSNLDAHPQSWTNDELQRQITALSNGSRWSDRIRAELGSVSERVRGADPSAYGEMISWLVARYYDQPEDRDAIYALLTKIAAKVRPEVRVRNRDAAVLAEHVLTGTSAAMTLLFIWECKGELVAFGRRLKDISANGLKSFVTRAETEGAPAALTGWLWRSRKTAETVQEEGLVLSQAAKDRALARAERAAEELGEKAAGATGAAAEGAGATAREIPSQLPRHRRIAEQMRDLARQTAVGLISAGIPYGLYTLNEQSEAARVDPLSVLKIFQTFAFIEIEIQAREASAKVRALVESLSKSRTPTARKQARERYDEYLKLLARLRSELVHLDEHAKQFKGLVSYQNVNAQLRAYRERSDLSKVLRSPEDHMSAYLASSVDLERRIASADERIRRDAQTRGFAAYDPLASSLEASATELHSLELALKALTIAVAKK